MRYPRILFNNIDFPLHTHKDSLSEVAHRIAPDDGLTPPRDPFEVELESSRVGILFSKFAEDPEAAHVLELPSGTDGWSPAVLFKELQDNLVGISFGSLSVIKSLKFIGVNSHGDPVYRTVLEDEDTEML
ncbi:hypothetical protein P9112_002981 [Eukaryota sp. TZLM1-RC]